MWTPIPKMIAVDLDGTLLGPDGRVSAGNKEAIRQAQAAGVEVVIATGRRHTYAMRVLGEVRLPATNAVVSSNGTVTRTVGARLIERTLLPRSTSQWLCKRMGEFRRSLVVTFDRVGLDGEDERGSLVVEHLDELHTSIDKWMVANAPYIEHVVPIEKALEGDEQPIQMMLCGTVERMRRAEARLLEHPGVSAVGATAEETAAGAEVALHRTEYPERDLSIVDILPAGCSKGAALSRLAALRGYGTEDILALGDNWNDVSMLEVAGRAVLMGNAPQDLLDTLPARTWSLGASNAEDGVAQAIMEALRAGSRMAGAGV